MQSKTSANTSKPILRKVFFLMDAPALPAQLVLDSTGKTCIIKTEGLPVLRLSPGWFGYLIKRTVTVQGGGSYL